MLGSKDGMTVPEASEATGWLTHSVRGVMSGVLKKKLGLKSADLDATVKATCDHMKADKTKSRLTFYYLLAEHYGKLDAFVKK